MKKKASKGHDWGAKEGRGGPITPLRKPIIKGEGRPYTTGHATGSPAKRSGLVSVKVSTRGREKKDGFIRARETGWDKTKKNEKGGWTCLKKKKDR